LKSALAGAIAVRIGACNGGSCGYSSASNRLGGVPHGLSRNFRGCSRRFHGCSRRNRGFADGTIRLKNRGRGSWSDAITHDGWPSTSEPLAKPTRDGVSSRAGDPDPWVIESIIGTSGRDTVGYQVKSSLRVAAAVGYHVGLIVQRLTGRGFSSRSWERRSRLVGYRIDSNPNRELLWAITSISDALSRISRRGPLRGLIGKQSFLKRGLSHRPLSRRRRGRIAPNVSPVPV